MYCAAWSTSVAHLFMCDSCICKARVFPEPGGASGAGVWL